VDFLRICKNHSFATVQALPRVDRHGFDVVLVVAKLSYVVDELGNVRLVPSTIHLDDLPDGHGGLRYPTDLEEEKLGTDFGLVGTMIPARQNTTQQLVWLQIGGLRRVAQVFGPRVYERKGSGVVPGPPSVLGPTPLVHALAYGGSTPGGQLRHPKNPVGRGFSDDVASLVGQPAHRIERVDAEPGVVPIDPPHAVFAPIPADWEPRRSFAGTHDAEWADRRAPVRPVDFDPRHHCWSVPELHHATPARPDVPIEVGGVTAAGVWRFRLPGYGIEFAYRVEGELHDLPSHLDGYLIDADEGRVELSFRAAIRLRRKWERLEKIHVYGTGEMPDSVFESPARPAGAQV
jgi:hypothetical protein